MPANGAEAYAQSTGLRKMSNSGDGRRFVGSETRTLTSEEVKSAESLA